ncbi:MAG: ROK family protein [Bryobacteraceae bacterium]
MRPRWRDRASDDPADGPLCGCGNRGCLETLAGGPAHRGRLRSPGLPQHSAHVGPLDLFLGQTRSINGEGNIKSIVTILRPSRRLLRLLAPQRGLIATAPKPVPRAARC